MLMPAVCNAWVPSPAGWPSAGSHQQTSNSKSFVLELSFQKTQSADTQKFGSEVELWACVSGREGGGDGVFGVKVGGWFSSVVHALSLTHIHTNHTHTHKRRRQRSWTFTTFLCIAGLHASVFPRPTWKTPHSSFFSFLPVAWTEWTCRIGSLATFGSSFLWKSAHPDLRWGNNVTVRKCGGHPCRSRVEQQQQQQRRGLRSTWACPAVCRILVSSFYATAWSPGCGSETCWVS